MTFEKTEEQIMSDSEVMERLQNDSVALLTYEPFFAHILVRMYKKIDHSVPVAGVSVVDGDFHLHINPKGYFAFTQPERVAVLVHEICHLIFRHWIRKKDRDHSLWNIATDIAINQIINTDDFYLPTVALTPKMFNVPAKRSAEEYYNLLWNRKEKIKVPEELMQGLGRSMLGDGNCPHCGGTGQEPQDGKGNSQTGDGNNEDHGEHENGHSHGDSGNPCPHCKGSGKSQRDGLKAPDFSDWHPTWDKSTEISEGDSESLVRSYVQDAKNKAEGELPDNMVSHIEDILQSKVNWRAIFRNFVAKHFSPERIGTWKRMHRRYGEQLPGYRRKPKLRAVVAVDTSGSISDEDLALFNGEIHKMYKAGADITVIEIDAAVHNVYKYSKKIQKNWDPQGRGGTSFVPLFKYVEKEKLRPDVIIYLTDGFGEAPASCSIPTLWALTSDGQIPYVRGVGNVEWGYVVKLED